MPRPEFKTQVLLLHSEQSKLESLSAGFGDRYTVHFATTGSEALQTLGETPINIIVSAQHLPGMSGLEAIREAKRRSPETVGILIAEGSGDGLEALASDAEVFEVLRGNVTSESILKLLDNAAQQLRLMALAESANDTAAVVDATATEHIVMETSDDGAAIISDGSGRLPVLSPTVTARAAASSAQAVDLLVLTRDEDFLTTIKNASRDSHGVHYANTLAQADEIIRKHNVGVTVIDAGMIGKRIEQLTEYLRRGCPRLVCIVAGRRDDGEMLMDLINRSKVYRFLLKPVSPGRARLAIEASARHHCDAPDAAFVGKSAIAAQQDSAPKFSVPEQTPLAAEIQLQSGRNEPSMLETGAFGSMAGPESGLGDNLGGVFGPDDASLTNTITGMFATIGKKLSPGGDATSETTGVPPDGSPRRESALGKIGTFIAGAVVAVAIAGAYLWFTPRPDNPVASDPPVATALPEQAGLPQEQVRTSAGESSAESSPESALETGQPPVVAAIDESIQGAAQASEAASVAASIDEPVQETAQEAGREPVDVSVAKTDPAVIEEQQTAVEAVVDDGSSARVGELLVTAENALLESRFDDAEAALQQAERVDPDNARLPFLTTQLSQAQLRVRLAEVRSSILDGRLQDAAVALAAAQSMQVADRSEVDAVADELDAARSQKLADDVLSMANARLQDGALLSPANDNARYFFELALVNDPENTTAREGLRVIASKLALQARAAIEKGDFDEARSLLGPAAALEPSNREVAAAVQRLESASRGNAKQPDNTSIQRAGSEGVAAKAPAPKAASVASEPPVSVAKASANTVKDSAADNAKPLAEDSAQSNGAAARKDPQPATSLRTSATPVAASSLNRIKFVAPKYPRSAQRRDVTGWVDVLFTVDANGAVKDVEVKKSEPGETFDQAAISAVEKWEFEPVVEDGSIVEKRAGVRLMFALE